MLKINILERFRMIRAEALNTLYLMFLEFHFTIMKLKWSDTRYISTGTGTRLLWVYTDETQIEEDIQSPID